MENPKPWEALPGVPLANEQFIGWETVPVEKIRPDPVSIHAADRYAEPDRSFDKLVASITKWGMTDDVIVSQTDEGEYLIIDGVRRFRAAMRLGLPDIRCMVYGPLSDAERTDLRDVIYFLGMELDRVAGAERRANRTLRRARDFSLPEDLAA